MSNTAILIKLLLNKYDNTHMFAQFYLNKIIDVLNTIGTSNELELPINQNEHKELVLNTLRSINTKDGLYQKYIDVAIDQIEQCNYNQLTLIAK